MKIAIIGAGFAGLATAWHLLKKQKKTNSLDITLFDPLGIGGKASGIAAGLLHPYVGLRSKLNIFGHESLKSTINLLNESEKTLGQQVYCSSGLLRVALTKFQEEDYLQCSLNNQQVNFLKHEECCKLIPSISKSPGIFIEEAKTVYTDLYLKGLFLSCQLLGLKFDSSKIINLNELNHFDKIVVTAGADSKLFSELQHLKLTLIKGQILELTWPEHIEPLPFPINSQAYILMNKDKKSCHVGATFERNFTSCKKDLLTATSLIMPKAIALLPDLQNSKILDCKAAVRVSTHNHLPLVEKIDDRLYVFIGLGSKGLLYHSFYAEKLTTKIL